MIQYICNLNWLLKDPVCFSVLVKLKNINGESKMYFINSVVPAVVSTGHWFLQCSFSGAGYGRHLSHSEEL